ncbi:hypothetical protein IMCC3317_19360 [Kordia antarctica]|uniref:Uncharacterized protein n=1 Tax=Kordia antarctica TaxID=1218801 RepID=A0A7L4ZIM3_9FLAO|nr:hypothetical protein [Kordia antarctica]QHI36573.1 hypothetical protein IMCC3317_19360 [Kordia antarctica]
MKRILLTILTITIVQSAFSQEKMNDLSLEYEAISKGYYQKIEIDKETLVFSEDRTGVKNSSMKVDNKQWKELVDLANKIKFKELSSLKVPSEKRTFYGVAHAQLKISFKDKYMNHLALIMAILL